MEIRGWKLGVGGWSWPVLAGVLALSLLWRLYNLDSFAQGYDEGAYLMWGALVSVGYRLYDQVRVTPPPLFIVSIAAVFKVLGTYVVAARAMILGWAVLLLLVVSLLARRAWGRASFIWPRCRATSPKTTLAQPARREAGNWPPWSSSNRRPRPGISWSATI